MITVPSGDVEQNRGGRREKKGSRGKRRIRGEDEGEERGIYAELSLVSIYKPCACHLAAVRCTLDLGAGVSPGVPLKGALCVRLSLSNTVCDLQRMPCVFSRRKASFEHEHAQARR